jgi:hypothetical protein
MDRTELIQIRITPGFKSEIENICQDVNISLSEFIRLSLFGMRNTHSNIKSKKQRDDFFSDMKIESDMHEKRFVIDDIAKKWSELSEKEKSIEGDLFDKLVDEISSRVKANRDKQAKQEAEQEAKRQAIVNRLKSESDENWNVYRKEKADISKKLDALEIEVDAEIAKNGESVYTKKLKADIQKLKEDEK